MTEAALYFVFCAGFTVVLVLSGAYPEWLTAAWGFVTLARPVGEVPVTTALLILTAAFGVLVAFGIGYLLGTRAGYLMGMGDAADAAQDVALTAYAESGLRWMDIQQQAGREGLQ